MSNRIVMPLGAIETVHEMIRKYGASNMLESIAIFYDNRAKRAPVGEAWAKEDQNTARKIRETKPIQTGAYENLPME